MRIAIAGLGNIGTAVLRLLRENADIMKLRAPEIKVVAISARGKDKARDCDLSGIEWVDDASSLALRDDVDVVVELVGGAGGVAYELVQTALEHSKHVVTANKAMIAAHGVNLAKIAEKRDVFLGFEAAVCGAIPVIKTLREGLAANTVAEMRGILNGTCNYILTRMSQGLDFDTALGEAQSLGYAEADPSADIDGEDAAQKLAILSALAFGTAPDVSAIFIEGIRNIMPIDLQAAADQGGCIKLMGIATREPQGVVQRVQPVFVPYGEPLAQVGGVFNALEIVGNYSGATFLQGEGAGGDATASSVVADLIDIARGKKGYPFGVPAAELL